MPVRSKYKFSRIILFQTAIIIIVVAAFVSCRFKNQPAEITAEELMAHIRILSDDIYEGRGLGSRGIELAALYQEDFFRQFRLQPFFGDSYRQVFTVIGVQPDLQATMEIIVPRGRKEIEIIKPTLLEDFVIRSERQDCPEEVAGEVLYCGYLIQAPERQWDDLKGYDVSGKILLVEINEPGNYPGGIFDGEDMTYYGRWTYKFEKASELGAAGILIIHNDKGATYGWSVVRNSWAKEAFFLPEKKRTFYFQGWITGELAARIFSACGLDRQKLLEEAEKTDFTPKPLGLQLKVRQRPQFREVQAENVVGWLPSHRPEAAGKYVIISAHYDHLGKDTNLEGDQIYNGAVDNCSATACLLALAGYYSQFRGNLPVNLIFAAVTAEEQNLLGSEYLAAHLPLPDSSILANINFEMTNVWGETEDVYAIGARFSELDDYCRRAAEKLRLIYTPERGGNYGFFFRSDQLSFARHGIPAVWLHEGVVARGQDPDRVRRLSEEYLRNHYHQVTDEFQEDWDLRGALQLLRWAREIIELLGKAEKPPSFRPDSAFQRPAGGK